MSDSNKQTLLLIAITVCLVLVLQPNAMSSFVKKAEAPRRVMSEAELQLFTTTAEAGEIVMVGANGVLIDQGSQAVRVGTDSLQMITGGSERVRVNSTGNVGIGTTSPDSKLHIYAGNVHSFSGYYDTLTTQVYSVNFEGSDCNNGNGSVIVYAPSMRMKAPDLTWIYNGTHRVSGAEMLIHGGRSDKGSHDHGEVIFKTGDSERFRISGSGSVGIGTNDPKTDFHLSKKELYAVDNQDVYSINLITSTTGRNGTSQGNYGGYIKGGSLVGVDTYLGLGLYHETSGYFERIRIRGNGNVGIGTTDPKDLLHVGTNDVWSNVCLGTAANAHNVTRATSIYKPTNYVVYEGALAATDWSGGGDMFFHVTGLNHGTWGAANYGGSIVIEAGSIRSRLNQGNVTQGHELGGDVIIKSGSVVARNESGDGPYKRGGDIYLQTGDVNNVSGLTAVNAKTFTHTSRLTISGQTGNVGIGTWPLNNTTLTVHKSMNITPQVFKVGGSRGTYYKVRIIAQNGFVPASFTLTREIHLDGLWTGSMNLTCDFRGELCGNGSGFIAYKYKIYNYNPPDQPTPNKFVARCTTDQSTEGGCTGSYCWLYLNGNTSYYFTGNNCFVDYYSPNGTAAGDANPTLSSLDWPFANCGNNGEFTYDSRDGKHSLGNNNMFIGNVGIGTTNPLSALHLDNLGTGNGIILSGSGGTQKFYMGGVDQYSANGTNNLMIQSWWGIGFSSYDGVTRAAIDTRTGNAYYAGNVGIGTTSPATKLHVNGGAQVDGTLWVTDTDLVLGSSATGRGAGGRALVQNTNNQLVINYAGDFGGGVNIASNTIAQGYLLAYGNGLGGPSMIYSQNDATGDAYAVMHLRNNLGSGCYWFLNSSTRDGDGGANMATLRNDVGDLRIQNNSGTTLGLIGNYVGIGTTNPYARLDVRGQGDGDSTANWISGCFGVNDDTKPKVVMGTFINKAVIGAHNGSLSAWSNLYVNPYGFVCIGTTVSPQYTLEVGGPMRASGGYYQPAFFCAKITGNVGYEFRYTETTNRNFSYSALNAARLIPGTTGYYSVTVSGCFGGVSAYKILTLYKGASGVTPTVLADCMTSGNNSSGNPFVLNAIVSCDGATEYLYVTSTDTSIPQGTATITITYLSPL